MFLSLFLSLTSALATVRLVEAQPSAADAVRFLEQSTFGPTPELIARVRQAGFEAFLDEQLAAPISDYLELPFWPQTRPQAAPETAKETTIHTTNSSATSSLMPSTVKTNCARGSLLRWARYWLPPR